MFSSILTSPIFSLYARLITWILLGLILGRSLPKHIPKQLAKFLFFVGTPLTTVIFMQRANLSGQVLIAPLTAWIAILVGAALAWVWIDLGINDERIKAAAYGLDALTNPDDARELAKTAWSDPTQGSFLLAMMIGNTGFLGFPVVLSLVGSEHFAWALFYDILGNAMGSNLAGIAIASHFGNQNGTHYNSHQNGHKPSHRRKIEPIIAILKNPSLWAFGVGFMLRYVYIPVPVGDVMQAAGWAVINVFLILIGMQLSGLASWHNLKQSLTCLSIKMLFTPLIVGTGLMFFGVTGAPRLLMVLLMGMPPGFGTTLLAETYGLDRELAVTTVAAGCGILLFTIPLWMSLFG